MASRLEMLLFEKALLNGEEIYDFWPGTTFMKISIDKEFKKLVCEIMEFNPFGELFHCYRMYFIEVNEVKYSGQ